MTGLARVQTRHPGGAGVRAVLLSLLFLTHTWVLRWAFKVQIGSGWESEGGEESVGQRVVWGRVFARSSLANNPAVSMPGAHGHLSAATRTLPCQVPGSSPVAEGRMQTMWLSELSAQRVGVWGGVWT